ncbi:MAG: sigma 54-interacting transcriptional regulator [Ignavibacteriaceae bacterium]|nr:sigma 54-interacting transcriptional regulator [Ignavibacteriaceae bacterium]
MEIREQINSIRNLTKEQFEALQLISQKLNTAVYEDSLIEETLDWVINIINAERGLFVRYDNVKKEFSIISARNINKENITDLSEFSSGILKRVIEKKEPLIFYDVQNDPSLSQFESILIRKIKSVIGVPILRDNQVWGVIIIDSQSNRKEFTESNLIFLKFFSNLVSMVLDRIILLEKLQDENQILKNKVEASFQVPDMIGESLPMKNLAKTIHRVASTDATVVILGESGTGKDLAAHAIHMLSSRGDKPYLAQFCGSIPDTLLESELFGYKKGAFTGATNDKKGLLEVAENGTFFLDEIADISEALQAKLLRVIENKEITRLGDTQIKKVNVRIIAATNKDIQQLVKMGKFREDLYYRLNVFPITVPPLRERKDDIPLLAEYFINRFGKGRIKLQKEALAKLENYYWPGNIRQLMNVIQRALILSDSDKLEEEHIIIEETQKSISFDGTMRDYEKQLLLKRLEECNGNRTQTASSLGVSVRWVQIKLKEMGLQ